MSGDIKSMLKEEIEQYLKACGLFETLNVFRRELESKYKEDNDEVLSRKKKKSSIAKRYFESKAEKKSLQSKIYSARKKFAAFSKKLLNLDQKLKGVVAVRSELIKRNLQLLDELEAKINSPYFSDEEEPGIATNLENVVLESRNVADNELSDLHFNKYESQEGNCYDLLNSAFDHHVKCSSSYAESSNSSLFSDFPIIPDEELKNIYPLQSAISLSSDKSVFREMHHSKKLSGKIDLKSCADEIDSFGNKNLNDLDEIFQKNCSLVPEKFYANETVLPESLSSPCIYNHRPRTRCYNESNDVFAKNEKADFMNYCDFSENDYDKVSYFSGMKSGTNCTFSSDVTFNKKVSTENTRNYREKMSFLNTENDASSYNNYSMDFNLPYRHPQFLKYSPSCSFLDEILASRHETKNGRFSGKYLENSNRKSLSDPCQKFDPRNNENCKYMWKEPASFGYGAKFNNTDKQGSVFFRNLNNESVLNSYQKTNASYDYHEKERKAFRKQYLFENEKMFDKMNVSVELKTPFWKDKVKEYQNNISVNDQEQVQDSGDLGFACSIQSKSRSKMLRGRETDYFCRCKKDILPGSDSFFDKDNYAVQQRAESKCSDDISFSDIQIISDEELKNIHPLSSLVSLASTEDEFCKNRRKFSKNTPLERKIKSSHSRKTMSCQEKIEDIRITLSEISLASTEDEFCKNRRKFSKNTPLERKIKSSHSRKTMSCQEKIEDIRVTLSEIYLNESKVVCSHGVFHSDMFKQESCKNSCCCHSKAFSSESEITGKSCPYSILKFLNSASS